MRTLIVMLSMFLLLAAATAADERSGIPEELKWDLTQIYPDQEAWTQASDKLSARLPELSQYQGHLGDSAESLYAALSTLLELDKELDKLRIYAMFLYDQDTRVAEHLEMQQSVEQLSVQFSAASAFFRPEILSLDRARVDGSIASDPRLKIYAHLFDDIFRGRPHTLSQAEEKIAAQAGNLANAGEALHSIFTNADLPYPEVTLSTGEKVRLDAAAYTRYRASTNREDRKLVFRSFWGRYQDFRRTLGTALYNQVKAHIFDKEVHKYDSSLQASLFPENIPTEVYHQLIDDVHANLPTLHRYLKLRGEMMGLDQWMGQNRLGYEDLYAPITQGTSLRYTPIEAMDLTLKAVAPLGPEYQRILKKAYDERWVDFLPSTGKRSGAYSEGAAYDVHPYQLLNYMGGYVDVSTLAHEDGHTMHSYLANQNQPFGLHDYSIFVAEVASTLNEALLLHYMLDHTEDDEVRLSLLGSYLENLRQTLFRQVLFAEFELKIHERAENGESLTGDNMNKLYLDLLRTYYGHDQGVCTIDDLYAVEWAYIPHFYYNFYVYQYATSLVASTTLAHGILEEAKRGGPDHPARDAYLAMLSAGDSDYPIELLRKAGVDMTTSAPFEATIKEMNRVMDEIEEIRARH